MKKHLATGFAFVIEILLFLFMVFVNGHFFMGLMPVGWEVVGLLGLAAVDGGVIAWYLLFMRIDQGNSQRTLSVVMFILDIVAAIGSMVAELTRMAAARGEVTNSDPNTRWIMLVAAGVAIGLNVGAYFAYKLFDPKLSAERKKAQINDSIREQRDDEIEGVAITLGKQWAKEEVIAWKALMQHDVDSRNASIYESIHRNSVEGKAIAVENEGYEVKKGTGISGLLNRAREALSGETRTETAATNLSAAPAGPTQAEIGAMIQAAVAKALANAQPQGVVMNADAPTQVRIVEAQSPK